MTANVISLIAAISVFVKGEHLGARSGTAVMSFNAAISSSDKGGQWDQALALPLNVASFSATNSACDNGGKRSKPWLCVTR